MRHAGGLALWKSRLYTVPVAMAITAAYITTGVVTSVFDRSGASGNYWFRAWSRRVLRFVGVQISVEGEERIRSDSNYIVVANHASLFDIPVLGAALPLHLRFMAKRELLRVPFIGWWMRVGGHLPVDRQDPKGAIRSLNEASEAIRQQGLTVLVFAEGTRSDEGVGSFKDGAAYLAIRSGAPVLPVAINGTQHVLRNRTSLLQAGDVVVSIGEPVTADGISLRDREEFTLRLESTVRELYYGAATRVA